MGLFKVVTLAILLQVWTLLGAAALPQLSNPNLASLNLVGPNITPAGFFPGPFDYHKGSIVIRFHGYRKQNTVPPNVLNGCYFQAEAIALDKIIGGQGEVPMGTDSQW
ncbi:hypothetical protein BDR22DRAFT_975750 [Usnea florida]